MKLNAVGLRGAAHLMPSEISGGMARRVALARAIALDPALIIGVPVGFVNVVESKELFLDSPVPHIIARGRKGGSNVAAAICNALLYQILR